MCNASRNADSEQRTGYGGGFMDRQAVEYKEKKEIGVDEEFDEFGRRKRKGGKQDNEDGFTEKRHKIQNEEDDDDEDADDPAALAKYKLLSDDDEEEDGSDADLDKYDLTADPEVLEIKDVIISKFYSNNTRADSVVSSE